MRSLVLSRRNLKEALRDPLSLGLTVGLPLLMLVVLQALEGVDAFFSPTSLAPGDLLQLLRLGRHRDRLWKAYLEKLDAAGVKRLPPVAGGTRPPSG